jgi:conjugal transfer pilus assembly protein TraF
MSHLIMRDAVILAGRWASSALLCLAVMSPAQATESAPVAKPSEESKSETTDPFWQERTRGWFWYEKKPDDREPPVPRLPATGSAKPDGKEKKPPEVITHEALTKRADELMKIAFVNPTKANVEAYLRVQTMLVNKSSTFADVWQRVIWENPELDFAAQGRPVNAAAIKVYDREQDSRQRQTIASLVKDHALLFFFKSDCPYCHQFAPLLKNFEAAYGLRIFPVSLDGGGLPDFREFRTDAGQAQRLNVTAVPAVYLVNPSTNHIKPIGFGILSETELANRLFKVSTDTTGTGDAAASVMGANERPKLSARSQP